MVKLRKGYVDGRYGQIHYRIATPDKDTGAPPVYCLHQSPKSSLEFETLMGVLGEDRVVVAPDYPGYGMSDRPPTEDDATIPSYAASVWELAEALSHDFVDLFGNHTGSKVATEMAVQHTARVRSIAMVSAAILTDEEREMFKHMFLPIPLDKEATRITTTWQRIFERAGPGMTLEMMDRSLYMTMMGGEAYEWGHAAAFAFGEPFEDALRTLPQRITILNPADDLQIATRRANDLLTNGEVIERPDWSYGFMDAFPGEVADLLRNALDTP